ncbi:NADP-dependent oxidoreductase [Actinopolymorpha alba]|uniref:NADP-dependent oxidoreductase n=1 Tax=Actinopolymorpha alba TaxID=533267 RepID=UPI00037B22E6|nr:NADP-dependent oxidoreductase [Actinopolymorpha alba]
MLAVTFAAYGEPSVLQLTTMPEPHAGPGQVRIRVRTAGVNPIDWKVRGGYLRDIFPTQFPAIPGAEAAGVVDEVGEGMEGVNVGDEVFGLGSGTYAELAVLHQFARKPAALTWEQAGGVAVAAETALRALEILHTAAGQTLLIDGAAGGVGSAAARFALAEGVTVIGTASEANHAYLRDLGVVPTTYGPGLPARVAGLAPNGVDVAFDTAGKGSLKELIEITGSADRVVTIANFAAAEHGVRLTTEPHAFHALPRAARLVEEGRYDVAVDSVFPLADAARAHERSEGGHVSGKIILAVADA